MATYDEGDAIERVWMLLRDYGQTDDEQLLTDTEVAKIGLRGAEQVYSRVKPMKVVEDLTANGTSYLALPAEFMEGFSVVESIEWPPDRVPPEMVDGRDYLIARDGSGNMRIVWGAAPPNLQTVRIVYTVPRVIAVAAADTTIYDFDFTAFCDLAASFCADAIAAKYARTSEPAFNADAINYRTRAQEWRDIARRLWERSGFGGSSGDGQGGSAGAAGPASAWANWDIHASWGGPGISHPRYGR